MKLQAVIVAGATLMLLGSAPLYCTTAVASVNDDQVTSQKLKEADGTTGQNTNSGSGVKTNHIQNGAVVTSKIADGAVTGAKLVDGAVGSAKIADGAVTGAKLADPVYTKTEIDALIGGLQSQIAALQGQNVELSNLLQHFSVDGNEIFISGANLHIVNGLGNTDGYPNTLGNLILGYNELRNDGSDARNGSHNLVLGRRNNYLWSAGIIGGEANESGANFSSVLGGWGNATGQSHAVVVTGHANTASGTYSSVVGGQGNTAVGPYAAVLGGSANVASGNASTIGGGVANNAAGQYSSVSGGSGNQAIATTSSVGGGTGNSASGMHSSVSGGLQRSVSGEANWAAGSLLELQ